MQGHLDENIVVALFRGTLSGDEVSRVDAHIDGCSSCRMLLSNLAGARAEANEALKATTIAQLASTRTEASPPTESGWRWAAGSSVAGRFDVEELIGTGGMGDVYRARDRETGAAVALKVVTASGDTEAQRFEREARLLAELRHPGIVRYVAHGTDGDGTPFLAMEWLQGEDLAIRLKRGRLGVERTVQLGVRVAEALAAAHAAGIVHRDIKPSNIFLREGDVESALVLDFGVARAPKSAGLAQASTRTGVLLGTVGYMAPEQARGAKNADARADVFSLGCVLYECLTGVRAFTGTDTVEVLAKLLMEDPRPPRTLAPDVPAALDELVSKMLSKKPGDRPDDCAYVAAKLRATQKRSIERATPRRSVLGVSLAIALGLLVALGGIAWKATRRGRAGAVATRGTTATGLTADAAPAGAATSPRVPVLILGIENRTSDPVFDGTLDDVFASAIMRSSLVLDPFQGHYLRILAEELDAPHVDETVGQRLVQRDGGRVVMVRGSVAPEGAGYTLSITTTEATGATLFTSTMSAADATRVIPTVARLAAELRTRLGEAPPADPRAAELTSMSSSLEADHEFTVGRGLADSGKYPDAIAHLRRAVAYDPHFAKAYQVIGIFLSNMGRQSEAVEQYELALKWVDGMSEKEKLHFLGDYYRDRGDYGQSAAAFDKLLGMEPGEVGIEIGLSVAYRLKGESARALDVGRKAVEEHPKSVIALSNLSDFELSIGDLEGAARDAARVVREFPYPPPHAYVYLAAANHLLGNEAVATEAYAKLTQRDAPLAASGAADLALANGRPKEAVALLEQSLSAQPTGNHREPVAIQWGMLAEARLRRGETAAALVAAERAGASGVAAALYSAAEVFVATKREARALALATKLAQQHGQDPTLYAKLIVGNVLRAQGKYSKALSVLEEARRLRDGWLVRFGIARTHLDAGNFAEAEKTLKECVDGTGEGAFDEADGVPTLRYLPPATYYLARALEGEASPDAAAIYRDFVARAPNAEGDPLIDDARRRIAGR